MRVTISRRTGTASSCENSGRLLRRAAVGEGSIEPTQILVVLNWSCSRPLFRHRQDRRRRYGRGVSSTGHQARPGRGTEGAATKPNRYSRRGTLSADRAEGEPLARYTSLRVGRSLPELQDEVRLLRLPPAFAAVPQYRVHTPGDSCPSQNRTSGFPRHPAPRGVIQRASALRHGFRSMRIRDVGQPTYCRA